MPVGSYPADLDSETITGKNGLWLTGHANPDELVTLEASDGK